MPYKDKYMEYLRGVKRGIEKREERRTYNKKWSEGNKEHVRETQLKNQRKWQEENREYYNMRSRAQQYCLRRKDEFPIGKECELCPEDEIRTDKLQRRHPDYDYPTFFITVCPQCQRAIHIQLRTFEFKNKEKKEGDC